MWNILGAKLLVWSAHSNRLFNLWAVAYVDLTEFNNIQICFKTFLSLHIPILRFCCRSLSGWPAPHLLGLWICKTTHNVFIHTQQLQLWNQIATNHYVCNIKDRQNLQQFSFWLFFSDKYDLSLWDNTCSLWTFNYKTSNFTKFNHLYHI